MVTGPPRQPRTGPCLDFGFQYALIRTNRSKKFGVEYWTLPGSNSPWRPCTNLILMCNLKFKSGILFIYIIFLADVKIIHSSIHEFATTTSHCYFTRFDKMMNIVKNSQFKICLSGCAFKREKNFINVTL